MPERLRLNNYRTTPVKAVDVKPPSPSVDTQLAPLKVSKAKQSPAPLNVKAQHTSPTSSSPRETGTPENNEGGKQWARKGKVKTDALTLSPVGLVFTRVVAIIVGNREWRFTYLHRAMKSTAEQNSGKSLTPPVCRLVYRYRRTSPQPATLGVGESDRCRDVASAEVQLYLCSYYLSHYPKCKERNSNHLLATQPLFLFFLC